MLEIVETVAALEIVETVAALEIVETVAALEIVETVAALEIGALPRTPLLFIVKRSKSYSLRN